jgi:hypothetical protein
MWPIRFFANQLVTTRFSPRNKLIPSATKVKHDLPRLFYLVYLYLELLQLARYVAGGGSNLRIETKEHLIIIIKAREI